ncbi:MAG: histidine phosphatase family protein [Ruminococcaceae bacterium]|nr:histidine phosphatase family protein [Oscillospiraceae bacterium]
MKTYKIHLIRHGMTEANEKHLYIGGRTDLPLSPEGLADLIEKKKVFEYPTGARYFTGPLKRCRQTLEVLYPGCKAEIVEGLTECDFGEWDGKSLDVLKQTPAFSRWLSGEDPVMPGGEHPEKFQERVANSFEAVVRELMSKGQTEAVICTHGGVIMLIMAMYGLPRAPMNEWATDTACGFTLRITPELWMREPVAEALCAIPWEKKDQK